MELVNFFYLDKKAIASLVQPNHAQQPTITEKSDMEKDHTGGRGGWHGLLPFISPGVAYRRSSKKGEHVERTSQIRTRKRPWR